MLDETLKHLRQTSITAKKKITSFWLIRNTDVTGASYNLCYNHDNTLAFILDVLCPLSMRKIRKSGLRQSDVLRMGLCYVLYLYE